MPRMRCKVKLSSLSDSYNSGVAAKFTPVTGNSDENKSFHAATPGGSFEAVLSKECVEKLGAFKLGEEYYVDFTPAVEASA